MLRVVKERADVREKERSDAFLRRFESRRLAVFDESSARKCPNAPTSPLDRANALSSRRK